MQRFWTLTEWFRRAQTWWTILATIPSIWAAVDMHSQGMEVYEILLFSSAILCFCMVTTYYGYLGYETASNYLGDRKERLRVISILDERRLVGDTALKLVDVATIWHGKDVVKGSSTGDIWLWNAKFRRLKKAVDDGHIRGSVLTLNGKAQIHTYGDISDLIEFFKSHK